MTDSLPNAADKANCAGYGTWDCNISQQANCRLKSSKSVKWFSLFSQFSLTFAEINKDQEKKGKKKNIVQVTFCTIECLPKDSRSLGLGVCIGSYSGPPLQLHFSLSSEKVFVEVCLRVHVLSEMLMRPFHGALSSLTFSTFWFPFSLLSMLTVNRSCPIGQASAVQATKHCALLHRCLSMHQQLQCKCKY